MSLVTPTEPPWPGHHLKDLLSARTVASTFQLEFWKGVQTRAVPEGTIGWVGGTGLAVRDVSHAVAFVQRLRIRGHTHAQLPRGQHQPWCLSSQMAFGMGKDISV